MTRRASDRGSLVADLRQLAQIPDREWALERVTRMQASAMADAAVYGKKLLKGFGYPDEVFSRAQDARALSIVLALVKESAALLAAHAPGENDDHTRVDTTGSSTDSRTAS